MENQTLITTKLRNGSEEATALVTVTMMSLKRLFEEKPIVVYELTMKCRDSSHEFFGESESDLQELALVDSDGRIHGSIKNIILSAVQGEGLDMTLGSPKAPE